MFILKRHNSIIHRADTREECIERLRKVQPFDPDVALESCDWEIDHEIELDTGEVVLESEMKDMSDEEISAFEYKQRQTDIDVANAIDEDRGI